MKDATDQKWATAELASVSKVFTDGNWIETKDQASEGIRLVQTGNVGEGAFKDRRDKARWIDDETFDRLNCFEVLPGDCLVSRLPDPVGRACIIPETGDKMITAVDCTVIRPDETKIDTRFFVYYSLSSEYLRNVDDVCTGTTRRRISRKNLGKIPIPLPPLEEQQRIVAVLDEAFEGLARARAHAEANLQNARKLFENSLEAELEAVGNSNETSLGEHIDLLAGFAFKSKGYTEDQSAMRLMRGDNIIPGAVRWEGAKYWPIEDCEAYEKFQLCADDVLIAMDRTWIKAGIKYAVLTDADVPSLLVQRVARLRCLPSLDTHFLEMLIGSKSFERYVLSIQTGTGVPHISPTQIKDFKFPLPDIETQAEMVERLLIVKNGSNELSESYSQKVQDIDDCRRSLLQKAFAGELS